MISGMLIYRRVIWRSDYVYHFGKNVIIGYDKEYHAKSKIYSRHHVPSSSCAHSNVWLSSLSKWTE